MSSDYVDYIYNLLNQQLEQTKSDLRRLTSLTERAETAGGVTSKTLADAPTVANGIGGVTGGDMLFISNGRKVGQGAGAGTGIPAYYDPTTDSWRRLSDDTAVLV